VVRQLLTHARTNGVGHTYLIQHSAGSGKSNSITWTAYQLIELYAPGSDLPMFDSVVVVTDRRILDKQIRDNIKNFSQVGNIIAAATSSAELKTALETGKRIIITTIQKFPFIVEGVEDLSDRNFAIIIDEAHSSQSGQAADKMNMTLGNDDEESEDIQDKILKAMEGRKLGKNASYFAFTATPKNTTLEKFGQRTADDKFVPFHLYSMKQAIEEGFILDVLANYTTYRSYYEIQKSISDNPLFETTKAQRKLRDKVEGDYRTIETKAEVMVSHFIEQVWKPKKLKGHAKAMVVTSPLIDTAAARFNEDLGLEEEVKIDFKIKAKQFVKIYGQVACIIPYNNIHWEKLYWFLKFLIPKLTVRDPEQDQLDELLNSVDLSTYGLERVQLNYAIALNDSESELNPQNPNPRGYRGDEPQQDPLDQIITAFNDRFFSGWEATPQEQRVKFLNIARHVVQNPDFQNQVVNNQDEQNRRIALEQIIQQAINQERKRELDLYKRYASDPEFKRAFDASIMRLLAQTNQHQLDQLLG
jgi:type I site-specific restriction-modification system R (restriction) subunit